MKFLMLYFINYVILLVLIFEKLKCKYFFYIISEEKLLNYIYVVKGIVKLIIIVFNFFFI